MYWNPWDNRDSPPLDPDFQALPCPAATEGWLTSVCPISYRFSSNSIGNKGAKALAEALKVNQVLESLE